LCRKREGEDDRGAFDDVALFIMKGMMIVTKDEIIVNEAMVERCW